MPNLTSKPWVCFANATANPAVVVGISLSLVLSILISFDRFYLISDNVSIFENAYDGEPVRYVSALWSWILFVIHKNIGYNISIYAFLLYTAHIASIALFIGSLHHISLPKVILIFFIIPYVIFYAGFLVFLDYTSTSIMLGGNAIMAFAVRWKRGVCLNGWGILSAILLMVAGMIRIKGGMALLVMGIPFFLLVYREQQDRGLQPSNRTLGLALLIYVPLITLMVTDNLYKTYLAPPAYKDYTKFNQLRGPLHNVLEKRTHLQDVLGDSNQHNGTNWKNQDIVNFYYWIFFDERIFNTTALQNIHNNGLNRNVIKHASSFYSELLPQLASINYLHASLVLLLGAFWLSQKKSNLSGSNAIYVLFIGIYFYAVGFITYILMKFPLRVAHPIFLINLGFILTVFPKIETKKPANRTYALLCASFMLMVVANWSQCQYYQFLYTTKQLYKKNFIQILKSIKNYDNDAIVMIQPGKSFIDCFDPVLSFPHTIRFINLGWNTFSPRFFKQISLIGATKGSEIIPKMAQNQHAYVLGDDFWIDLLHKNYINTYYPEYSIKYINGAIDADNPFGTMLYRVTNYDKS